MSQSLLEKSVQISPLPVPCQPDSAVSEVELEPTPLDVMITRESVNELLAESIEIAMGRMPMKLTLTISRNLLGKRILAQKDVEIFTRDRHATIGVLKLLGQGLDMFKGESAPIPPPEIKSINDPRFTAILEKLRAELVERGEWPIVEETEADHDL